MMKETIYTYRHIARIVIEATTPIAIGTGSKSILTDAPVMTGINGLPYIPATSVAGILRHALNDHDSENSIFGWHDDNGGAGSRLVFTDAVMIGAEGRAIDGAEKPSGHDDFYAKFEEMPIRQHVRIDKNGVAEKNGKFDNQVVFKGTRFVFEVEMYATDQEEKQTFEHTLSMLYLPSVRIGGGTRNGYGAFKVVSCKTISLDLTDEANLKSYLDKSACLCNEMPSMEDTSKQSPEEQDEWTTYKLELKPDNFFLFGSGQGDDDADMTAVVEPYIKWSDDGKPTFTKGATLIPATSIKGALAHRTAYHWNRLNEYYVGNSDAKTGCDCPAVADIFGVAGKEQISGSFKRGNIILSDIFLDDCKTKVVNHNAIDRFTGGTIEGALFSEKVNYYPAKRDKFELNIMVKTAALDNENTMKAFECALNDICNGMLPLGGGVNRGNGVFTGTYAKLDKNS